MKWILVVLVTQFPPWWAGYPTRAECDAAKAVLTSQVAAAKGKVACVPGPDVGHPEPAGDHHHH